MIYNKLHTILKIEQHNQHQTGVSLIQISIKQITIGTCNKTPVK